MRLAALLSASVVLGSVAPPDASPVPAWSGASRKRPESTNTAVGQNRMGTSSGGHGTGVLTVPETAMTLRAAATSRRFIAAHGRRATLVGYAAEGLEGWIYPFRIFHDLRLGFRREGEDDVIPGSACVREIMVNPDSVTLVYSGQDFTVRETLFVPLDEGGFSLLYEAEGRTALHIVLSFEPDLDLMWPGGIGGQNYDWDAKRKAFVLQESSGRYSALVGSPAAGAHSSASSYAQPWVANRRLSLELEVPAMQGPEPGTSSAKRRLALVVSLGAPPYYDAAKTYEKLLETLPQLYADSVQHYRDLLARGTRVETPDLNVNLAYAWARIALDQAYVCNPWLGCGLVAGYGPSRDTRRPQYAWFFGGDALNNTWALEAAGHHDLVRDAVRFIQKYQKKDTGEVFHEISQSAGLIDWFKDYPYSYRHTDASAMYLAAFRNFYRSSGDRDFLRASWSSLKAAYHYLVSRIDPSDGLVTVPAGGWGGDETIGEQVVKDVYLESVWVTGAESLAELASLSAKFWNPKRNFFFYGFNGRGELLTQELAQPNWGIWLGAFDADKSERALDRMAHADWESDWGLRSIPSDDPLYIGDSYGHGSVWPLGTGIQSLAFYRHHRPLQAESLWHSLIEQSFLNSLGHVTEVFSGDFYRELDVSVPEQVWSSGMVITSLLRGLLGLEVDAPKSKIRFAPHLPSTWPSVRIRNLKVGPSQLNLEMQQSERQIKLKIESTGARVEIEFAPELPLGSTNLRTSFTADGGRTSVAQSQAVDEHAQDRHAVVSVRVEHETELVLSFDPGVRPWLPATPLGIGDHSRGLRILSSRLERRTYRAEVEGRPGACSAFALSTPWQVKQVTRGVITSHDKEQWHFAVSPKPDTCESGTSHAPGSDEGPYQAWTFEVEFAP